MYRRMDVFVTYSLGESKRKPLFSIPVFLVTAVYIPLLYSWYQTVP